MKTDGHRQLANFLPDLWGDNRLLNYTLLDELVESGAKAEVEKLREKVRKELMEDYKDPKEKLVFIDTIQRLGLAYHFEEVIEAILQNVHNTVEYNAVRYKTDLHYVSLQFRILRQHGFPLSSEVFDEFKNEDGSFKESISSDLQGMLSLYEASNLRVHGEDTLDEALAYTSARLESFAKDVNCAMSSQIAHALKLPLFKRSTRLESIYQISIYETQPAFNPTLLRLAKLDFNCLQVLHRNELRHITRWSKSLDLNTKFPYSRDRLTEAYIWSLGVWFEPKYSQARILLNKMFKIIVIIDDTYDAYGTLPELMLFTDAIQRWDKSCMSGLPDYMKLVYELILDTLDEFEEDLAPEGRAYVVDYLRQEIKDVCINFIQEAKWCHQEYIPTFDEYMKNGIGSSVYYYMITAAFLKMGDIANKHAFEWIHHSSKAPKASGIIARISNDLGSHKFEQNRGHVASVVECYIQQFGVTENEANEQLKLQMEEAWKDIKQDMLQPTVVPMPLLTVILNACRSLNDLYDIDEDGYTVNHYMQTKIEAALKNPMQP